MVNLRNVGDATRFTDKTFTPIDHYFISKDQIMAYRVTTTPFNSECFLVIFQSKLSLKSESDNLITIKTFEKIVERHAPIHTVKKQMQVLRTLSPV